MTSSSEHWHELDGLLDCILDNLHTPDDVRRLNELLRTDAEACRRYINYIDLHGRLVWGGDNEERGTKNEERGLGTSVPSGVVTTEHSASLIPPIIIDPLPSPLFSLPTVLGSVLFSYLMAAVILGVGLAIAGAWKLSDHAMVAHSPFTPPVTERRHKPEPKMEFVGRISGMADCEWSDASTAVFNGAYVPLGRKYALASGLMEITYDSGAKVILQGPVTYEVESAAGGYLSVGKLTARLEKDSKSKVQDSRSENHKSEILNHKFVVRTPTAVVTDLGTEFGVEVSKDGDTTSHVFRGSVELQTMSAHGTSESITRVLHENESARVENCGGGQGGGNRITVLGLSPKSVEFVRTIRRQTIRTLDLVDMVAGGNGFGKARDCGIDPTTGKTSTKQPDNSNLWGDGHYHTVPERPLIDGVFIPCPAKGPVQLDSVGHTFAGFPTTAGSTWGYIWAGGPLANLNGPLPTRLMRGLDYSTPWHSLLGMHANKGITFDLAAIRHANPRGKLIRFSAVAGKCQREHAGKSDVWVFVDGQLRFQREQIAPEDGQLKIAVALDDESRFLTLAATDGGDGPYEDVVIFGDPKLVLAEYSE